MEILNNEGYPTEEFLDFVRTFRPNGIITMNDFVEGYLKAAWWPDGTWGFTYKRKIKDRRTLRLSTGGWSGNEEIIAAIKENFPLSLFYMRMVQWRVGGGYTFKVLVAEAKNTTNKTQ
jgi:hypothetical protein